MSSFNIRTFEKFATAAPHAESRRIIKDDTHSGVLLSPDDTRTWKFFCCAKSFDNRNRSIRQEFSQAMEREFGTNSSLGNDFVSDEPLSARTISDAIRRARSERHNTLTKPQQLVEGAIDHVMGHDDYPIGVCLPVYRGILKDSLRAIVLDDIPEGSRQTILNSLAADLARQLGNITDQTIRHGIAASSHIARKDQDRDAKVTRIANQIAEGINDSYPVLHDALKTRGDFFHKNINQLLGRIGTPQKRQAACNRCKRVDERDMEVPQLTQVKITNSDPHNGGKRVMILTFHDDRTNTDRHVVYKPRDCRVDEKICGAQRENFESVASVLNRHLPGDREAIPTYQYLTLGDDATGRYGFVQFLPHEDADYTVSSTITPDNFYKDMGRHVALNVLCGLTDMHQGNYIVSGGRPYATDLEMAFSHDVYKDGSKVSIDGTMIEKALSDTSEKNPISGSYQPAEDTQNFLKDSGDRVDWKNYGGEIRAGFMEIMEKVGQPECNAALRKVFEEFKEMHVRLHPLSTTTQLMNRQAIELNLHDRREVQDVARELLQKKFVSDYPEDSHYLRSIGAEARKAFYKMAYKDWSVGDVAYFTRKLSPEESPTGDPLYHNGEVMNKDKIQRDDDTPGVAMDSGLKGGDVAAFKFNGLYRAMKFLESMMNPTDGGIRNLFLIPSASGINQTIFGIP